MVLGHEQSLSYGLDRRNVTNDINNEETELGNTQSLNYGPASEGQTEINE